MTRDNSAESAKSSPTRGRLFSPCSRPVKKKRPTAVVVSRRLRRESERVREIGSTERKGEKKRRERSRERGRDLESERGERGRDQERSGEG